MAKKFSQIKSTRGKRGRVWTSNPANLPRYYFGGDSRYPFSPMEPHPLGAIPETGHGEMLGCDVVSSYQRFKQVA